METRVDMVVKKKEEVEQKLTEVEKQLEHANKENETLKEKISKVLYNVHLPDKSSIQFPIYD
jgi:septation ring formation regulator EzrA